MPDTEKKPVMFRMEPYQIRQSAPSRDPYSDRDYPRGEEPEQWYFTDYHLTAPEFKLCSLIKIIIRREDLPSKDAPLFAFEWAAAALPHLISRQHEWNTFRLFDFEPILPEFKPSKAPVEQVRETEISVRAELYEDWIRQAERVKACNAAIDPCKEKLSEHLYRGPDKHYTREYSCVISFLEAASNAQVIFDPGGEGKFYVSQLRSAFMGLTKITERSSSYVSYRSSVSNALHSIHSSLKWVNDPPFPGEDLKTALQQL